MKKYTLFTGKGSFWSYFLPLFSVVYIILYFSIFLKQDLNLYGYIVLTLLAIGIPYATVHHFLQRRETIKAKRK